ncbi:TonB-dependent receptor [Sphingomonas sp. YL-JM2C]
MSRTLALSAAAGALLAGAAHAQTGTVAAPQAAAGDDSTQDIVVTAQRRSERLVDVPISIASVSEQQLANSGTTSIFNLTQNAPGLRLDTTGPYVSPTIRGVGTTLSGPGLNSNVAIYMDGFYIPNQLGSDFQLISISNVQVLKGPQGTLFGRNSTGGAILVTTKDPTFDTHATVKASYGSFNRLNGSFYASTGLSDKIAVNLTGFYEQGDGYVRNVNTGHKDAAFDKWSVRGKLLFQPSDTVKFVAAYGHSEADDPTSYVTSSYQGLSAGNKIPGVTVADGRRVTSNGIQAAHDFNGDTASLTGEFDMGGVALKSYTQYRDEKTHELADYDGTAVNIFTPEWRVRDRTFNQEFNLSSTGNRKLSWVAGLYYYHNKNQYNDFQLLIDGLPAPLVIFDSNITNKAWAAFGDVTWNFADRFYLTGGLRYGTDKVNGSYDNFVGAGSDGAKVTFHSLSPRASLRYEIDRSTNVYASYNRGYKAGFLPISAFAVAPKIKPEKIDAFEVGFKTAKGPFHFETSAFYYNYKDLQVAAYIGVTSIFRNAATSRIWGLDSSLTAKLTDNFDVSVSGTYIHAKYRDFQGAVAYAQDNDPTSPTFSLFNTFATDASGNIMPRSPKFMANLNLHYGIDLGGGKLDLNANGYYTTRFYYDAPHQFSQGAYGLVNLRATYTTPDERWAFSVYGTNVTDTKYRSQVLPGTYAIQQTYGEPAAIGASVTFNY